MFDPADAIITVDERFHIRQFNLGATDTFGYAAREVIGGPLGVLLPDRVRGMREAQMRRFVTASEMSLQMGAREALFGLRRGTGLSSPRRRLHRRSLPGTPPSSSCGFGT